MLNKCFSLLQPLLLLTEKIFVPCDPQRKTDNITSSIYLSEIPKTARIKSLPPAFHFSFSTKDSTPENKSPGTFHLG